ncbi:hypothetical protein Tsubulata_033541 [Turnera subulata]|uniref:NB-ARC domain-containing protein n=1 Tax=Turnera subulata TaxID=218843 RepID=A0A9Q0FZY2_9ROSI|nr:hypothetical protein Tsubulata_033541 [Turnera subulata]
MEIIKQTVRIFEWKTAMHSVAGMVGWVYPDRNNYRSRTQLIGKIVKDMLGYLQRPSPNVGVQLVLSNTALKEMNLYLCEQLEDMDIIWICGPAGMSNNTIARFIYGVMAKTGIEAIASRISTWTATTVDPTRELMNAIQGRLQHKNVLVMVDDVYLLDKLVHLAILQNALTPESRIIVSKGDPANKNMVHVQSLSFDGPKRNWHRKALDISFFKQNINDHEMGILRSLVSGGLHANTRMEVLIQTSIMGISGHHKFLMPVSPKVHGQTANALENVVDRRDVEIKETSNVDEANTSGGTDVDGPQPHPNRPGVERICLILLYVATAAIMGKGIVGRRFFGRRVARTV